MLSLELDASLRALSSTLQGSWDYATELTLTRLIERIVSGADFGEDGLYEEAEWVVAVRSLGVGPSRSTFVVIAVRLAEALAEELDKWPGQVAPYRQAFGSSFEPAYAQAADLCRSTASLLGREAGSLKSVLRSTGEIIRLVGAGVRNTPDEPVGLIEVGHWHELGAITLQSLVVLALSARSPASEDDERAAASPQALSLISSLAGDVDRLQTTIGAAEEMVALLLELAHNVDTDRESAANAGRLASVVGDLAKSSPPPPRSFNAAMLDAAQLLRQFDPPLEADALRFSESDGLPQVVALERASQLNQVSISFVSQPLGDDGGSYAEALSLLGQLGDGLTTSEASAAQETFVSRLARSKTGQASERGYLAGVEKLISLLVSKGIPAGIVEGLGWITNQRSWLAALVKFVIGILV